MSEKRRHPNIVNATEVDAIQVKKGKHQGEGRRLGAAAGGKSLGAMMMKLPPGGISFPFHFHCGNEEAIYVLSGAGIARIGDARVKIGAGDYIAYPPGPAHAHQMINDGTEPLVYLCISTQSTCEVVGYPDSKKVAARAGESWEKPWVATIVREGASLDYWEGEPEAQ